MAKTYTLDLIKDGIAYEDHGLTEQEVSNACANAPRLGIIIRSITEETPLNPDQLAPFSGRG